MRHLKKLFRLALRIVVVVFVFTQLTFLVKFLNLLVRQGTGPAFSYLRGDHIAVQSAQGTTATLVLVHQAHPYLTFTLIAIFLVGGTLGLFWLDRSVGRGPRIAQGSER
jgi:hypothetical protein